MDTIQKKQTIKLYRYHNNRPVTLVRDVRNIRFDSLFMLPVGEVMYKGFIVSVGLDPSGSWSGRNPSITLKERAQMFLNEDR